MNPWYNTSQLRGNGVLFRCLGSAAQPHDEVRWFGCTWATAQCWFCPEEGRDLANGRLASTINSIFAEPKP